MKPRPILVALVALALASVNALSADWIFFPRLQKLVGGAPADQDHLGHSVDIDGYTVAAGAEWDSDAAGQAGSVSLFEPDGLGGWPEVEGSLTASDAGLGDYFGYDVALDGDVLIVGARGAEGTGEFDHGAAYVFERDWPGINDWGEVAILTASDGQDGDELGQAVAVSGDTAAVGAYKHDDRKGAVYVFQRDHGGTNNWGEVTKITASDPFTGDHFGAAVAIRGDTILVGARHDDDHGPSSGSAYVFGRHQGGTNNWGQVTKITAGADGQASAGFGWGVALADDHAVVGAPYADSNFGATYIFARPTWTLGTKLSASDGAVGDIYGETVDIDGDWLVAVAWGSDPTGALYVYKLEHGAVPTWREISKITESDAVPDDTFGWSTALAVPLIVGGAPYDDELGQLDCGSASLFRITYIFGDGFESGDLDGWTLTVPGV